MKTLHAFKAVTRLEEQMMRSVMPRTSERDATPLRFNNDGTAPTPKRVWRVPATLTFKLSEVSNG
jgi:hypothetical protein